MKKILYYLHQNLIFTCPSPNCDGGQFLLYLIPSWGYSGVGNWRENKYKRSIMWEYLTYYPYNADSMGYCKNSIFAIKIPFTTRRFGD